MHFDETSSTHAPFYVRIRNAVISWPLKRWVSLVGIGFLGYFIGGIPVAYFQEMDPSPTIIVVIFMAIALCGTLLFVISALVSFVMAHFVYFGRRGTHVNRALSRNVLLTGYMVLLLILGIVGVSEGGPDFLRQFAPVSFLVSFGLLGWLVFSFVGIHRIFGKRTTPQLLDFYESLPHVNTYIHHRGASGSVTCYNCNSTNIEHSGLTNRRDNRRVHKCMICNTWLYKSHGLYA